MKQGKKRIISFAAALSIAFSGLSLQGYALIGSEYDIPIIVSVGDSYSSGEGMPKFYGQDKPAEEKVHDYDWIAHRSKKAWSGQLTLPGVDGTMSDHRGTNWFFAASSGAVIDNFIEGQERKYNYESLTGSTILPAQLDVFNGLALTDNDYVTVSIGGNDIGFEEVLTALAMKSVDDVKALIETKRTEFDTHIKSDLKQTYRMISQAAGKETSVIVTGYPTLLNKDGFKILFFDIPSEKTTLLNDVDVWFNGQIRGIVNDLRGEGMNIYFVDVIDGFSGHEAYTETPYINEVFIGAQPEDIDKSSLISGYSIHPNESGAAVYAMAVQNRIDSLEAARGLAALPEEDDAHDAGDIVSEGCLALKGMEYDFALTPAQNRERIDKTAGETAEKLLEARRSELDSRIAAEKELISDIAAGYGNSAVTRAADDIIGRLDEITYDPDKSFAENAGSVKELETMFSGIVRSIINGQPSGGEQPSPAGSGSGSSTDTSAAAAKEMMRAVMNDDNSVTVSWNKISGASKYILYYEKDGKDVKVIETAKNKVTIKTAKNNFTYKFKLKYITSGQTLDAPAGYKAELKSYYKPAVKLTQKDGKVTASWKKVPDAESYKVYKVVNGKLKFVTETTKNAVRFSVKSGSTYTYSVSAVVNGEETTLLKSDRADITIK